MRRGREGPRPDPGALVTVGVADAVHDGPALRWALAEASRRGARVDLLHAVHHGLLGRGPHEYRAAVGSAAAQVQQWAHGVAAGEFPDVPVGTWTAHQEAGAALLAASARSDLLVLGARGRAGARGLTLGTTAEEVARRASCPVAVVREVPPASARGVVVGVGAGPAEAVVVRAAAEWAGRAGEDLTLVRVCDALDTYPGLRSRLPGPARSWFLDHEHALLDDVAAAAGAQRLPLIVRRYLEEGPSVAGVLVEEAADALLLVVGSPGAAGGGTGAGRVTRVVLHCSRAPVLVVPVGG